MHAVLYKGETPMFTGKFITPPTYLKIGGPTWPADQMIFLAGPIQGAPDWQAEAVQIICSLDDDVHIASPRRPGGFVELDLAGKLEQWAWERHHLLYVVKHGVTLFWCANEAEHSCERGYAQTTRYELGKQLMRHFFMGARMVVGFDSKFSGQTYLKDDILNEARLAGAEQLQICTSLRETCEKAVELLGTL